MSNPFRKFFKPGLELIRGTRFVSFLFIGISILIGAGILWAANLYYNIDTGQIVMEEVQNVTKDLIISGANQALKFTGGTNYFVGFTAPTTVTTTKTYVLPQHGIAPPSADYVLTYQAGDQLTWKSVTSTGAGVGTITAVGNVTSGAAFTSDGTQGTSLWFYDASGRGQLTIADLTAVRTYTLPDTSGTVAVTSTAPITLSAAGVIGLTTPLAITYGGTGTTTSPIAGAIAYGTGSTYAFSGAGTLGQALVSGGTGTPTWFAPTAGSVIFAGAGGVLSQDNANFYWATTTGRLGIGTSTPAYPLDVNGGIRGTQLRINGAGAGDVVFNAPNISSDTAYTWPISVGTDNYVLTTDGSGGLTWESVTGVGAVTGLGEANRLAKWTSASNIATSSIIDNYTGDALTIAVTTGDITIANNLTVSGTGGVTAKLFTGPSDATTTIGSLNNQNIYLDPNGTGKIIIASGDYIKTAAGYEIGKTDTEILREMIPILGFDLPVRCATSCQGTATTVSRTIEDYSFSSASAGTNRIHKFVIRYADSTTTASSTWTVWNVTDSTTTATFTVPPSASTDLAKGEAYITPSVTVPIDTDDWSLRVLVPSGVTIQIYEVFLAAYDKIL